MKKFPDTIYVTADEDCEENLLAWKKLKSLTGLDGEKCAIYKREITATIKENDPDLV